MAEVIRWMVADYLKLKTRGTAYVLCKTGFTKLDEENNPEVKESKFISDKSSTKSVTGYATTFPFETDLYTDQTAVMELHDIGRNKKVGAEAVREYVRTDVLVDANGNPLTDVVPARWFQVSCEVSEETGESIDTMKITGNLNSQGDPKFGIFNLTSLEFTEGTIASGLTVTSVAGSTTGTTTVTVSPAAGSSNTVKYRVTKAMETLPLEDSELPSTGWTAYSSGTDITATNDYYISVVELDEDSEVVKAGQCKVTAKVS